MILIENCITFNVSITMCRLLKMATGRIPTQLGILDSNLIPHHLKWRQQPPVITASLLWASMNRLFSFSITGRYRLTLDPTTFANSSLFVNKFSSSSTITINNIKKTYFKELFKYKNWMKLTILSCERKKVRVAMCGLWTQIPNCVQNRHVAILSESNNPHLVGVGVDGGGHVSVFFVKNGC